MILKLSQELVKEESILKGLQYQLRVVNACPRTKQVQHLGYSLCIEIYGQIERINYFREALKRAVRNEL